MRTYIKSLFLPAALLAGLGLISVGQVTGQVFTTLYHFTATSGPNLTNSGGAAPYGGVVLSGNRLYGTATAGGSVGFGTVFGVNTDGTGFTNLHTFINSEGCLPMAGLAAAGNILYGTTTGGSLFAHGAVFAIHTDGTGLTNLHEIGGFDPAGYPKSRLMLSGNMLYGAGYDGGGFGGLFKLNADGTGFSSLHLFNSNLNPNSANEGGANPEAELVLLNNSVYGTTVSGGFSGWGVVFKANTVDASFTALHHFTHGIGGANPIGGLVLLGNTLYGTASGGGSVGNGMVFAINTDGTGFTNLHSFSGSEGSSPNAGMILSGTTLYGTTTGGGDFGSGTVFAINTDGTGFTTLHSFNSPTDGGNVSARVTLSGNTLYGTANRGGSAGNGTVFSLTLPPPQLVIVAASANVILTWPTNVVGFTLQSTTNLVSPSVWNTVLPAPISINGQNTVTNVITGTQKFYRLSQ